MIQISFSKDKDIQALMLKNDEVPSKQLIYTKMLVSGEFKLVGIDRTKESPSVKQITNLFDGLTWLSGARSC